MERRPTRAEARALLRQYQIIKRRRSTLAHRKIKVTEDIHADDKKRSVEEIINRQIDDTVKTLIELFGIIEQLPQGSLERDIIERRYIDGQSWTAISRMCNISRSQAAEVERRGIEKLIENAAVQKLIHLYKNKEG